MSTTPNLGLKTRSSSENEGNFIDYRLEISGTNPDSNMMIIDKAVGEHLVDTDNPHSVNKVDVDLGNVDNTSDADKPVSAAQQAAINNAVSSKQDKTDLLAAGEVLSDDDSIPFYDVSATSQKKTLWSNVKAKLKTYFDSLYAAVVHKHTRSQITDFPSSMPPTSHSHGAADLPSATTSAKGVVQLNTATNSTSTSQAATPSAVKSAYDLASGKANSSHSHSADNITSGTLPVARGGTGLTAFAEGSQYCGIDPNNAGKIKPERASAKMIRVSSNTTLSSIHAGCCIEAHSSTAITITIPANAYPVDTEIEITRGSIGEVTITPASGVNLYSPSSGGDFITGARTIGNRIGSVCLKYRGGNAWYLQGDLG